MERFNYKKSSESYERHYKDLICWAVENFDLWEKICGFVPVGVGELLLLSELVKKEGFYQLDLL